MNDGNPERSVRNTLFTILFIGIIFWIGGHYVDSYNLKEATKICNQYDAYYGCEYLGKDNYGFHFTAVDANTGSKIPVNVKEIKFLTLVRKFFGVGE